jgi:hypothetical protein
MNKTDIEILDQMFYGNHLNDTEITKAKQLARVFNSYLKPFNTYNGWTNYATWIINLEIFDANEYLLELASQCNDVYELSKTLEQYVIEVITENCENETTLNYAISFIENCNFYEIASHYTELIKQQKTTNKAIQ